MVRRGFTLIELLVVVSILAVLVAAVFPAYTAIRRSQRVKRVEATLQTLASSIEAYQNDFGRYPPADAVPGDALYPGNRGIRSVVYALGNGEDAGGRSAPYLPSSFYRTENTRTVNTAGQREIRVIDYDASGRPVHCKPLLDEWDHPYLYFDASVMKPDTSEPYDVRDSAGNSPALVQPAWHYDAQRQPDYFCNMGRFQLWSVGPNGRNDNELRFHPSDADDIANFVPE